MLSTPTVAKESDFMPLPPLEQTLKSFQIQVDRNISRTEAIEKLQGRGPWTYLLRDSSDPTQGAISYVSPSKEIKHTQFTETPEGGVVSGDSILDDLSTFIARAITS